MDADPAPGPLYASDIAALRAARAWLGEPDDGFWDVFRVEWRASLRYGWSRIAAETPDAARDALRDEHAAQARPDLSRVHVSWWVRALRDEPPHIRRVVVDHLPPSLAEPLREGLAIDAETDAPDRPPHPAALAAALALWNVRLIGDAAERPDDPPVIIALTQFDAPTVARLMQVAGLAKWSITPRPAPAVDPRDAERLPLLRKALDRLDPRFVPVAVRDVDALPADEKRPELRIGLVTFARLLAAADPYRSRWALQHVPYATARLLRPLMSQGPGRTALIPRWEGAVLRAAWDMLHAEGRLPEPWSAGA